jgi:hypothetical protein
MDLLPLLIGSGRLLVARAVEIDHVARILGFENRVIAPQTVIRYRRKREMTVIVSRQFFAGYNTVLAESRSGREAGGDNYGREKQFSVLHWLTSMIFIRERLRKRSAKEPNRARNR